MMRTILIDLNPNPRKIMMMMMISVIIIIILMIITIVVIILFKFSVKRSLFINSHGKLTCSESKPCALTGIVSYVLLAP